MLRVRLGGRGLSAMVGIGGASITFSSRLTTGGKRGSRRSQAERNATISSWLRPMKFHHMTMSSPNGTPPRMIIRPP